ncbi:MAG: hypothetical protein R2845_07385 [Thermomicrobiales bacterium]
MVGLRWLVFGVTAIVAQNQGGLTYYSLDLERGITTPLLTTEDGINYLPPTVLPGEGRYALIPSIIGTRQITMSSITGPGSPPRSSTAARWPRRFRPMAAGPWLPASWAPRRSQLPDLSRPAR